MIRIANITVQSGFSYQKYLSKQLAQVLENVDREQEYRAKDILLAGESLTAEHNPLALYTRSGGALFDEWGLSGHLDSEKINTISKLALGKDSRTKDHIEVRNYTYQSVRNEYELDIPLTKKDIENGFYKNIDGEVIHFNKDEVQTRTGFKKKTDIEFVFTQDATFSYKIAELTGQDKIDAEQMLIDCAIEIYGKSIKPYLKSYDGQEGDTGYYLYYHNDNRQANPFSHIHFLVPNMVKLPDGSIKAIEIPELRDQHFHEHLDSQYKSLLVSKWNARFKDAQAEAYDKDGITITQENQQIHDWRISYDEPSLKIIADKYKVKDLIDAEISKQKLDLFNKIEHKRNLINKEAEDLLQLRADNNTEYPSGLLVKFGSDNYQFNKENEKSNFITVLQADGKEKSFWGVDILRALEESKAKQGDFIELDNTKKESVKVNVPVLDENGKKIKGQFEEKYVDRATWNVKISNKEFLGKDKDDEIEGRLKRLNRSYEQQLNALDSGKNRDKVWKLIKDKKKGNDILIKNFENAEEVKKSKLGMSAESGKAFHKISDEEIIENLTNTSPFFTRFGLINEINRAGVIGPEALKVADDFMERLNKDKAIVSGGMKTKTQEQFTTWDLIKKEEENVALMKKLFNTEQKYRVYDVDKEINLLIQEKGITPNSEQQEFIKTVFNNKKGQILIGLPGTGKSLAAGWATEIANKHKFRTIGLAPTGKVASSLASETAVNISSTVDKFNHDLASGKLKLNANDLIFMDESSMVGTKNFNKLLKSVSQANAKLILIGDPNQIQSVSVGNTLNEFLKDKEINPQVNYLVEIRRQKDKTALTVAETSALKAVYKDAETMRNVKKEGSHIAKAIEIMMDNNLIKNKFITTTEAMESISKDYLNDKSSFKEKLIITSTNDTINRINDLIQDRRFESGELNGEAFKNKSGSFFVGDRVVMEQTKKEYKNGDFGTILSIDHKTNKIKVAFDNNKIKEFSSPEKMRLGYATTFEKSQGMTVDQTFIFGKDSKNNNQELMNVGLTRARYNTYLYAVASEYQQVVKSFKRESERVSLITLGESERYKEKAKIARVDIDAIKANPVIDNKIKNINVFTKEILKNGFANIKDNSLLQRLEKFRKVEPNNNPAIFDYKPYMKNIKKPDQAIINNIVKNGGQITNANQHKPMNVNDLKINSVKPNITIPVKQPDIVNNPEIHKKRIQKLKLK